MFTFIIVLDVTVAPHEITYQTICDKSFLLYLKCDIAEQSFHLCVSSQPAAWLVPLQAARQRVSRPSSRHYGFHRDVTIYRLYTRSPAHTSSTCCDFSTAFFVSNFLTNTLFQKLFTREVNIGKKKATLLDVLFSILLFKQIILND